MALRLPLAAVALAWLTATALAQTPLPTVLDEGSTLLSNMQYSNIRTFGVGSPGSAASVDAADTRRYARITGSDGSVQYTSSGGVYVAVSADVYVTVASFSQLELMAGGESVGVVSTDSLRNAMASGGSLQSSDGRTTVIGVSQLDASWRKATVKFIIPAGCNAALTMVLSGAAQELQSCSPPLHGPPHPPTSHPSGNDPAAFQLGHMELSKVDDSMCAGSTIGGGSATASKSSSIGAIIGGVVGGLLALLCFVVGCVCWRRRRSTRQVRVLLHRL